MRHAEDNTDIVRRGYAAFNSGDLKTLAELFDENASWHAPGRGRIAGDYKGRDRVFAPFGRYGGETAGTFRATLERVFTTEDCRVVGLHHNTATRNGKQLDVSCCLVFELKDGRVTDGRKYSYDLSAWEAFWS
jgi:ketosteroid isomerase-like protein